jgi:hypothetical protein
MKKKEIIKELERRIDVMKHHAKGGEVEYYLSLRQEWFSIKTPDWIWNSINYREKKYSVLSGLTNVTSLLGDVTKGTPTREEITAKWVNDNDLKVGDTVQVDRVVDTDPIWMSAMNRLVGQILKVTGINMIGIELGGWRFPVESLTKVTKNIVPFTFEDYALFLGKEVRFKGGVILSKIVHINFEYVAININKFAYKEALQDLEFADGSPFGKEEIS